MSSDKMKFSIEGEEKFQHQNFPHLHFNPKSPTIFLSLPHQLSSIKTKQVSLTSSNPFKFNLYFISSKKHESQDREKIPNQKALNGLNAHFSLKITQSLIFYPNTISLNLIEIKYFKSVEISTVAVGAAGA
jgi:hypothetical protein